MAEAQKNVSFSLGSHDRTFIENQVTEGRFGNRTEVVRAGLRLLEDYENKQKLQRLRLEVAKGDADLQAGRVTEYENGQSLFDDIVKKQGIVIKPLRLILTDAARSDLKAIYEYIAKDSDAAAISFIQDLSDKLEHLAHTGITGCSRDWVSVGLRAFPYKGRCFYFRIIKDQMVVIRVLHGKQDVSAQSFFDEFQLKTLPGAMRDNDSLQRLRSY